MRGRDFRAEFTRLDLLTYTVVAEVGLHPSRLSEFLNGRRPMPASLADRLNNIIAKERQRQLEIAGAER